MPNPVLALDHRGCRTSSCLLALPNLTHLRASVEGEESEHEDEEPQGQERDAVALDVLAPSVAVATDARPDHQTR